MQNNGVFLKMVAAYCVWSKVERNCRKSQNKLKVLDKHEKQENVTKFYLVMTGKEDESFEENLVHYGMGVRLVRIWFNFLKNLFS